MFKPGSQFYIVAIAPDGTREAIRLQPETVEWQVKHDYPDILYAPLPYVVPETTKTFVEVSGVLADGRAWAPGAPMTEML